jgi:hypothetical protein
MINVLLRWRWLRPAWEFISCLTEFKLYECTPPRRIVAILYTLLGLIGLKFFGDDEASQPAYQVPHR